MDPKCKDSFNLFQKTEFGLQKIGAKGQRVSGSRPTLLLSAKEAVVLDVLDRSGGELSPLDIVRESGGEIAQNAVYEFLRRIYKRYYIRKRKVREGSAWRTFYTLTEEGRRAIMIWRAARHAGL